MEKQDLRSMSMSQMKELLAGWGEKPFHAKQLYEWVHKRLASDFSEMTNLSKTLREKLEESCLLGGLTLVKKLVSEKDTTSKYLFSLPDGNVIESVWMQYKHGNSVCISSQAGCRMGCTFCASTLGGLIRNLTVGEMLSQIYEIQKETGERVSNVVVMGMGEPLDNYNNLLAFLHILSGEGGLNISQRNITVSTCGLVDKMERLAEEKLQITLAISLHAPNDEIRRKTMPIANRYSMDEVLHACEIYFSKTGRRVTFEYSMIHEVNDRPEHAKELAGRIRHLNCHVNLIPLNEVKERNCVRSVDKDIRNFKITLEKYRINVTIRRGMGGDIDAACGQLRKNYLDQEGR